MDISLQHPQNGNRTLNCDCTDIPARKTPLQYSENCQVKWVQSLVHTVHCNMNKNL